MDNADYCGIYYIKNKLNSKYYVGLSKHIYKRWEQHKSELSSGNHHNFYLQNAWLKYGSGNFEFRIIEQCTINQLCNREKYWIEKYDSFNNGYNLTLGGDGLDGYGSKEKQTGLSNARKLLLENNNLSIIQVIARTENVGSFFYGQESFKKLIYEMRKEELHFSNHNFSHKLQMYWDDDKMKNLIMDDNDYNYIQLIENYCEKDRPNRNYFIFECIQYAYVSLLRENVKVNNTYCDSMPFHICAALAPHGIYKMSAYASQSYNNLLELMKITIKQ